MSALAPEALLQYGVCQFLKVVLWPPPDGPLWTAHEPQPFKGKAAAGIARAMGLKAGWPDLILIWRGRVLAIELKSPRGQLSPAQLEQHALLRANGVSVVVARSLEDIERALRDCAIPLRGSVSNHRADPFNPAPPRPERKR